jgi:hypothetical protein
VWGELEGSSISGGRGYSCFVEVRRMVAFVFFPKWWKVSPLQVFIDREAFIVCWMVAIAENACDIVRFVFR